MFSIFLLYFAVGAVAGLAAGLFGVGGGVIIVPALIYAFSMQAMPVEILTHMAVGTSLAIICISSISSVLAHHKNDFVVWPVVKAMAPGLIIGVGLGVYTVVNIPGQTLQLIMGVFLSIIGLQMGFKLMPVSQRQLPNSIGLAGFGIFSGWVSALFGIGGGSLNVPFLSFFGLRMQQAVATSAACGMPIALAGAFGNTVAGWGHVQMPALSLGFIYLPAFAGIAIMTAPFAKVGAALAKKLSPVQLKRIFAVFLVIIGQVMFFKAYN